MSLSGSRSPFHLSLEDGLPRGTQDLGFFYEGTTGDDTQNGSSGDDGFDFSQGGNDHLFGGSGDDEFIMKGSLTPDDQIDGGAGTNDTLILKGDYHVIQNWNASTVQGIERVVLQKGAIGYAFGLNDANIAAGQTMIFDGHALGATTALVLIASGETDGGLTVFGGDATDGFTTGAGNDNLYGGSGNDFFSSGNGVDAVFGGAGDDLMSNNFTFAANDQFDGGKGFDKLGMTVFGNSNGAFAATTMTAVEQLIIRPGVGGGTVTYDFALDDGNVGHGKTLEIVTNNETNAILSFHFNGAAELDGHYDITTTEGNDVLTGGAQSDVFHLEAGGNDTVHGGDGNDVVYAGSSFTISDIFDGGAGADTLELDGAYLLGFNPGNLVDVETIGLAAGNNYVLGASAGTVAPGDTLTVDGSALESANGLAWDSSPVTDAHFAVTGGRGADHLVGGAVSDTLNGGAGNDDLWGMGGNDILIGGNGNDTLIGLDGADKMNGGNGKDMFQYGAVEQSTGVHYDTVTGFDADDDVFAFVDVTHVDTQVTGGALDSASFNGDLAAAIGKHELGAAHAVLYAPDSGDLAGSLFLVIDANGKAGYQANKDLVVLLTDPVHITHLDTDNFFAS